MKAREQARLATRVLWLVLLTMPLLDAAVGGYTELGSRVLVLGLAAMALNFLLGFTGVLSFGHAAYFGLGAYGAGDDDQVSAPRARRSAILVGVVVGTLGGGDDRRADRASCAASTSPW